MVSDLPRMFVTDREVSPMLGKASRCFHALVTLAAKKRGSMVTTGHSGFSAGERPAPLAPSGYFRRCNPR